MFGISFKLSDVIRAVWTFIFTFLATFFTLATGLGPISNWNEAKAAAASLIPASFAAALSAVKNLFLADGSTLKG